MVKVGHASEALPGAPAMEAANFFFRRSTLNPPALQPLSDFTMYS